MRMGMRTLSSQVSRWTAAALVATVLGLTASVSANHPVLVEGEKDFDGDGLIGAAENTDGDLVFGTITAALAAANGAAAQNGRVTIVTSGRFADSQHYRCGQRDRRGCTWSGSQYRRGGDWFAGDRFSGRQHQPSECPGDHRQLAESQSDHCFAQPCQPELDRWHSRHGQLASDD